MHARARAPQTQRLQVSASWQAKFETLYEQLIAEAERACWLQHEREHERARREALEKQLEVAGPATLATEMLMPAHGRDLMPTLLDADTT